MWHPSSILSPKKNRFLKVVNLKEIVCFQEYNQASTLGDFSSDLGICCNWTPTDGGARRSKIINLKGLKTQTWAILGFYTHLLAY